MISNNYIPEKINDANAYLDGTRMIGVAASVDLPEVNMKTGTVEGFGVGGEIDSPPSDSGRALNRRCSLTRCIPAPLIC